LGSWFWYFIILISLILFCKTAISQGQEPLAAHPSPVFPRFLSYYHFDRALGKNVGGESNTSSQKMLLKVIQKVHEIKMTKYQNRLPGFCTSFFTICACFHSIRWKTCSVERTIFTSFKKFLNEHTYTLV